MALIAVATTGGDAPGMNAAVRAAVRAASAENIRVIGFERGYAGILAGEYRFLDARSVGGIIHLGGTFLKTSRAEAMRTKEGISRATDVLKEHRIDGLIVIGGNGSFKAACKLYEESGIPVIGIPATIDNDLAGTDTTIGFDTAVNTALEAVDKIRDTATSHERVFVVEVMGRDRGFIALEVGVAAGAEIILIPEISYDIQKICRRLLDSHRKGKKSGIIVMAEGAGDCMKVAEKVEEYTGFEVRLTRLGHIQRGGSPTAYSRLLACKMGAASVEFLLEGKRKDMTGIQRGEIVPVDLEYACTAEKPIDERLYKLAQTLST
ncbi:MAG: 6-phosphofructokinase [Candidatus Bathyarchaeia archaeon]